MTDGRRIAVSGYADRIDETADGNLVITDHKTGSPRQLKKVSAAAPTEGGTKFQLPVYAAAALAARGETPGATDVAVRAEYSFFAKGGYERYGYTFDDAVWRQVAADLQLVVDGIESGLYPSVTEPPQYRYGIACDYCEPDGLGVAERFAEWDAKRADPRIQRWFPLDDPGVPDDGDDR
jgi:RecB family exonuclease